MVLDNISQNYPGIKQFFSTIKLIEVNDKQATFIVSDVMTSEWINNHYMHILEKVFWEESKEELGYKLRDIETELGIDRDDYTEEEYDKAITEYLNDKNNRVVRFWDTSEGTGDKAIPKEYYNNQDLLSMVTRKKESTWAMLFPEEGWIEAGEMGWFGMSSLDSKDLDEKEEAIRDQNALTDNLIEKYKDTHIGLVVDCHI